MLEVLKNDVYKYNMELPRNGLVYWTSGNVSGRDPETNLIVIKPSGIKYEEMQPKDMVVVDLEGNVVEGKLDPSSDTASHLYIYRNRPDVNGVVHTHSYYATAFAAVGKPIPACITAIAENFGKEIPIGAYAPIGGEEIGAEVVRSIGDSTAIIMKNHGVFTIGSSPESALKSAILVEGVAKTYWLALQVGKPKILSDEDVLEHKSWYKTSYGQKK
ncbi:MAG: L-ribulose-5-phosphate 4-epimerase [Anaerolineaceae bacterium]|jgi:L-ribulose-5-phosphate 4-epimerase|nr:MAG: L-ribulose-5-phosphate 4-epimerase [Anaerolineaceae bacterium]